jgi:hypothetical protein
LERALASAYRYEPQQPRYAAAGQGRPCGVTTAIRARARDLEKDGTGLRPTTGRSARTAPGPRTALGVTADALDALGRSEEAKALRERYGLTESENPAPHERERYTFPRAPCVPTVPRTLAITPYAASLLNRELMAPAVVPRRSAMSLVVSPFGAARNNSITYFGNIVLMIARPPRMPRHDGDAGRASRVRAVNIGETRPSACGGWWRRLPRMIIARPCCLACPRRRKQARIARAGSSGTPRSFQLWRQYRAPSTRPAIRALNISYTAIRFQ